jgi:hypothetical protein
MHIKRSLAAVAVTGATAAVLFGGTTVSTAFSTDHNGSLTGQSASISDSVQNFDLALNNAIPGDSVTKTMSYTNNGTVPMRLTLTLGTPTTWGSADHVAAFEQATSVTAFGAQKSLVDVVGLAGRQMGITTVQPGHSVSTPVTIALGDADNTASGVAVKVPFTLHAQAVSVNK